LAQSVSRALQEVERVERTVAGTLRIAQSGRIELAPIDLHSAIGAARRTAAPEFAKRGVTLHPSVKGLAPLRILGNTAAMEQVLVNLLVNAAQAAEPGGHARLEIETTANRHLITVSDSGRGFEPSELARAFEPFYSTKAEGTGLGLTIVRRIVSAHGGEVAIESARGAGTRVRVTLPKLNDA
jgi:two-component system sensor histidine kinase HydH